MDRTQLETDATVLKLFNLVSPAKSTKASYINALIHFTNFTGMTPGELIEEGNKDIKAGKLMTDRAVFHRIPEFRQYLKTLKTPQADKPLAPGTMNKYVSDVCSFYKYFYIEVPKEPRSVKKVKPQKDNLKRPNKDEIRTLFNIADTRDKALILCGLSSGMGSAELASLTLEAFEEGYDPETEITMFDMRRGKVEKDFITFISPEASKAVIAYLEWRNRSPNPSDKRDVVEYEKRKTTPESYLFVAKKINRDYLETKNEDMRKLTPGTIKDVYKRLNIHTGMSSAKGTYNKVRSHNMRKHFVTTLRNEGCDGDLVKYFVGHTLGGSEDTYYEGNPDKLKDIYAKFVPYLTIAESIDVSETEAFMKVASENKVLADIHKEDTLKLREIEGLKAEMEEMKAFNNAIQAIMNNPEMRGKFNKLL